MLAWGSSGPLAASIAGTQITEHAPGEPGTRSGTGLALHKGKECVNHWARGQKQLKQRHAAARDEVRRLAARHCIDGHSGTYKAPRAATASIHT